MSKRQNHGVRLVLLGLACAAVLWTPARLASAEAAGTNSVVAPTAKVAQRGTSDASTTKPKAKPAARRLSGAELYSMHCNRCHPERYPTERTAAQWKTIMLHMRVRANLPGQEAKTILKYLQDNSGR